MSGRLLIQALQNPNFYDHPVHQFEVIETHISWVILTGDFVYKIKKPVNLGFLDFSSLENRNHYCQQEVILNRRLAANIYLGVITIGGSPEKPVLNGSPVIEHAVKMRQFPQSARLDNVLRRNELETAHIDQLADHIANFHGNIEIAPIDSAYGEPKTILEPIEQNFQQISACLSDKKELQQLAILKSWSLTKYEHLLAQIQQRKTDGFIRHCHGDMHLANIALFDHKITIFDCIEFNESLRWIDVISEIAFICMDLIDRNKPDFAARLLDRYLQRSGDYSGLAMFKFYQVYRALVRAKVAIIQTNDPMISTADRQQAWQQYREYTDLAETLTQNQPVTLFITHGVSGSGKTTLTQPLLEKLNLIRLRSDVERKRLFGMQAEDHTNTAISHQVYGKKAHQLTYHHLLTTAQQICESGFSVIVDATFLKQVHRQKFQNLANTLNIPFIILDFHSAQQLCNDRIRKRAEIGSDASEATTEVLQRQLATKESLAITEADFIFKIDSGSDNATDQILSIANQINKTIL